MENLVKDILINKILVEERLRAIDQAKVADLAGSITEGILINPITVVHFNNTYTLAAGNHRLEAYKQLGKVSIQSKIIYASDPEDGEQINKLLEIDENMVRNELTPIEQAEHWEQRIIVGAASKIKASKVKLAGTDTYITVRDRAKEKSIKAKCTKQARAELSAKIGVASTTISTAIHNKKFLEATKLSKTKLACLNKIQFNKVAKIARTSLKDAKNLILEIAELKPKERKKFDICAYLYPTKKKNICRNFLIDIKNNAEDAEILIIKELLQKNGLYQYK